MKYLTDYKSIVIVGGWNKHIFNPEWVKQYLFPKEDFKMEIPMNVDGSPRFSTKKYRVSVELNKLCFFNISKKDSDLDYIQELALKIADYLPHTPVISFGFNFLFEETENAEKIDELMKCNYTRLLDENDLTNRSVTEIKNSLEIDNYNLNFIVRRDSERYVFDFNYHFNIKKLTDFKEKISEYSILAAKKKSLEIISNVFDLELKDEK